MTTQAQIQQWVEQFADGIIRQTDAIRRGDARSSNRHVKRSIAAFGNLRAIGDEGREAMMRLLDHPRKDVRVTAAAYLLRYRTDLAMKVLKTESKGKGLAAFGASQAIKRWEEGDWHLDPEE